MLITESKRGINYFIVIFYSDYFFIIIAAQLIARMAELVDALVSNTSEKSCRFDSGSGYTQIRLII